jgi:hypothetical protein
MNWIALAEGGAGLFLGWAANLSYIRMSENLESLISSWGGITGGQAGWAAWLISLVVYGLIAAAGFSIRGLPFEKIKGAGKITPHVSNFVAGFGCGGFLDELINPPPISDMTPGATV